MMVREHLSNFKSAMADYLTDNGYDLDKEPEDETTFADDLESAAEQAVTEYRANLGDEGEDEEAKDESDKAHDETQAENEEPPAYKE